MPDVWATFYDLDTAVQERLAGVLETRGADPRQRAMREVFLADTPFPENARARGGLRYGGPDAGARSQTGGRYGGRSR
jgi:hypothetical protein